LVARAAADRVEVGQAGNGADGSMLTEMIGPIPELLEAFFVRRAVPTNRVLVGAR
jgi:hypothetical protein